MSHYRQRSYLTVDPTAAAVYARLADMHDESRSRRSGAHLDGPRVGTVVRLRAVVAACLRRLAVAVEPAAGRSATTVRRPVSADA